MFNVQEWLKRTWAIKVNVIDSFNDFTLGAFIGIFLTIGNIKYLIPTSFQKFARIWHSSFMLLNIWIYYRKSPIRSRKCSLVKPQSYVRHRCLQAMACKWIGTCCISWTSHPIFFLCCCLWGLNFKDRKEAPLAIQVFHNIMCTVHWMSLSK